MDTPVLLRQARAGDRLVSFYAAVLAAATTERPGAGRWTELTVYRLPRARGEEPARGGYVVAKVGRSTVLHRLDCDHSDPKRMTAVPPFVTTVADGVTPCLECQPAPNDARLLERDRFSLLQARTPGDLAKILLQGRPGQSPAKTLSGVVAEIVRQVRRADPDFDHWWPDHLYLEDAR